MSPVRLAEVEQRAQAATKGPWDVFVIASTAGTSSRIYAPPSADLAHIPMGWNGDGSNASFIAAAREDIPALCAALRIAVEALRKLCHDPLLEQRHDSAHVDTCSAVPCAALREIARHVEVGTT